jgi:hypothetical protein
MLPRGLWEYGRTWSAPFISRDWRNDPNTARQEMRMRECGAGKKRADESQYQRALFHHSIPRSIGGRLLRNAAVQATEFERSIATFLNGARLLSNLVRNRP